MDIVQPVKKWGTDRIAQAKRPMGRVAINSDSKIRINNKFSTYFLFKMLVAPNFFGGMLQWRSLTKILGGPNFK